jgi:septum formation protein
MKKLILASSSPTRKILLTEAGLNFEVEPTNYEEDMSLPMSPQDLVMHLSRGKAEDVAKRYKEAVVLGADTIIVYENKVLGKPHTPARAIEMLEMLSGKQHSAISGFTIIDTENDKTISKFVETKVFFRDLDAKEIEEYVATGEPLDKAGAYGILENGSKFIKEIEGSKTNIAGLPMEEVLETLKEYLPLDEQVDVVDENCDFIKVVSKKTAHIEGLLHKCVIAQVIDSQDRWLLVKQSKDRQDAGQYVSPMGGHVSAGENDIDALKREVFEELGLKDFKYEYMGRVIYNREVIGRKENHYMIMYKVFSDEKPVLSHEAESCRYFTLDELKKESKEHPENFGGAFHAIAKEFHHHLL